MAGLIELDSFVGKFVRLWQSGSDASLKVESKAGKATVILQLDLGHPYPPKKQVPSPVVRAAQYRRLQRRAAERKAAAEAVQEKIVVDVEAEQAKAEEIVVDVDAEQATNENVNVTPEDNITAEVKDATGGKAAKEAVGSNICQLCDRTFIYLLRLTYKW